MTESELKAWDVFQKASVKSMVLTTAIPLARAQKWYKQNRLTILRAYAGINVRRLNSRKAYCILRARGLEFKADESVTRLEVRKAIIDLLISWGYWDKQIRLTILSEIGIMKLMDTIMAEAAVPSGQQVSQEAVLFILQERADAIYLFGYFILFIFMLKGLIFFIGVGILTSYLETGSIKTTLNALFNLNL